MTRDPVRPETDARRAGLAILLAFLAPALLIYAAFTVYPVLRTFYNAFHAIKPQGVVEFVGRRQLHDAAPFRRGVLEGGLQHRDVHDRRDDRRRGRRTAAGAVPLRRRAVRRACFGVVWFTPVLMSYVVVGIVWVWIFDYDWGLANAVLRWLGLGSLEQSWLGHPSTALWSVLVAHEWKWLGFNMIVFLAALHALPGEVLGAAELDNCGWFAKLVHIIVPMLRATVVNLLVLSFIGKMMVFDLIWVMTGGGPLWSTETVSTYVYKRAFEWNTFDLGYPSAIAVLWFIIILAFVAIMTRWLRRRDRLEF